MVRMQTTITVEGKQYKIVEDMGFSHSIGKYAMYVDDDGKERVVVKDSGVWRFYTPEEKIR